MIKCLVCGKPQKLITPAHLRTHDLTADEYKARFPGAKMSSREFRQTRSEVMVARWQYEPRAFPLSLAVPHSYFQCFERS